MIKFFNANVLDATRIALIEGDSEDAIYEAPEASNEIAQADLPADFADWHRYTVHAYRDCTVTVMSRDGE